MKQLESLFQNVDLLKVGYHGHKTALLESFAHHRFYTIRGKYHEQWAILPVSVNVTVLKPGFHISRKDRKHMFGNMFLSCTDMAWSLHSCIMITSIGLSKASLEYGSWLFQAAISSGQVIQ